VCGHLVAEGVVFLAQAVEHPNDKRLIITHNYTCRKL
jgi:hypothetical protein